MKSTFNNRDLLHAPEAAGDTRLCRESTVNNTGAQDEDRRGRERESPEHGAAFEKPEVREMSQSRCDIRFEGSQEILRVEGLPVPMLFVGR